MGSAGWGERAFVFPDIKCKYILRGGRDGGKREEKGEKYPEAGY